MSLSTNRSSYVHLGAYALVLSLAWCLLGAPAIAQQPATVPPPPGYVVVGDEVLPESAVSGGRDAVFNAVAWPGGIVPFTFNANVNAVNQGRVIRAMDEIEAVSGVTFVPWTTQPNQIAFNAAAVNNSLVGMAGGVQVINLVSFNTKYIIVHEIMHALGFRHEQSRPNRNNFVTVNFANIANACGAAQNQSCANNFQIAAGATTVGAYDFLSIMHYGQFAFAANGAIPTITCNPPNQAFQNQIGNRNFMTALDAGGIAFRYGAAPAPAIASTNPDSATVGSAGLTLTVNGTPFLQGSPNGNGVQGTRVLWNGNPLPTTWVSGTQVTAQVSAALLAAEGCAIVQVDNPAPGGGLSTSVHFSILPSTGTPGFFSGVSPSERMGSSVAALGDVDGDGQDDVLVGAPGHDDGRGRAWCYSGADGSILWTLTGFDTTYAMGRAVANAGDIDGDGMNDALVGAPGYNNERGLIRVVSGATGVIIRSLYNNSAGSAAGDDFGYAVASSGDVNGDGTPDVLIGAPGFDSDRGRAFVIDGTGVTALFILDVANAGDRFGAAVAGGYDFGSNGEPDVVVGAPLHDTGGDAAGMIYTFSGQSGNFMGGAIGDGANDHFGYALAAAPSIDGRDGGCIIVGATEFGNLFNGTPDGPGYVRVFGPFDGNPMATPTNSYPTLVTFTGLGVSDSFGYAVDSARDYDQDGVEDILVGAPEKSFFGSQDGYIRVFSGRTGALLLHEDGPPAGPLEGDRFGCAVAGVGDTNGDGSPDILVGAPRGDSPNCVDNGYAIILHRPLPPSQRKFMITEVSWGAPDGVEITNFDTSPADLTGFRVRWRDGTEFTSSALAVTLAPGESLVVKESTGTFSETPATAQVVNGWPSLPTSGGDITVALITNNGAVVDEVRISDTAGNHTEAAVGGLFRGLAMRGAISSVSAGCVERIWGLDSNSGGDWTEQPQTSMGLENRSSGPRGTDPLPVPQLVINEIDDTPDFIEFQNRNGQSVDIRNFLVRASPRQNVAHTLIRPWSTSTVIPAGGFFVIGDTNAPNELPAGVPYVSGIGLFNIPYSIDEYDCALYDAFGRLVDLVRVPGNLGTVVHNHPRTPSDWADFVGAANRSSAGEGSIGRIASGTDTNAGSDWRPLQTRSMGSPNPIPAWGLVSGHDHALDVRLNGTHAGGGVTIIINAGPAKAGHRWSFTLSAGHLGGTGPILGLGADAIANYAILNAPPWAGFLDAQGSARVDIPPGTFPGTMVDTLFLLQTPAGDLEFFTKVLEFDN